MVGRPDGPRDPIAGPDTPQAPYPLRLRGPVIKGFGRGSKELGIPTANIPISGLSINGHTSLESGIYYGWASLDMSTIPKPSSSNPDPTSPPSSKQQENSPSQPQSSNHAVADLEPPSSTSTTSSDPLITQARDGRTIYPTVLSIGYNPYFANTSRSIELHLLSTFSQDFYGATLSLLILGYIRPEYDYVSLDSLVEDIREDIRVAQRSLRREGYLGWRGDGWLVGEGEGEGDDGHEEVRKEEEVEEKKAQDDGVGISYMPA